MAAAVFALFRRKDDFMRTLQKLCAATLALVLLATPALAASIQVVTNQAADVYRAASTGSEAVTVPNGVEMKLTDYLNGWGKVSLNGRTGYIQVKYLTLKKPLAVYLSRDTELYSDAGSGAVSMLGRGMKVYFQGIDGDYAKVSNSAGTLCGYVELGALTSKKAAASGKTLTAGEKIDVVLATARKQLGKPYALTADPPSSFNCAALVHYCFEAAEHGKVGAMLEDQVHNSRFARIDDIAALHRGDIVCFNFSGADDVIGHVGIYIGDGWFVHASVSDGKVTTGKLTSGYYNRTFSWGMRVYSE